MPETMVLSGLDQAIEFLKKLHHIIDETIQHPTTKPAKEALKLVLDETVSKLILNIEFNNLMDKLKLGVKLDNVERTIIVREISKIVTKKENKVQIFAGLTLIDYIFRDEAAPKKLKSLQKGIKRCFSKIHLEILKFPEAALTEYFENPGK